MVTLTKTLTSTTFQFIHFLFCPYKITSTPYAPFAVHTAPGMHTLWLSESLHTGNLSWPYCLNDEDPKDAIFIPTRSQMTTQPLLFCPLLLSLYNPIWLPCPQHHLPFHGSLSPLLLGLTQVPKTPNATYLSLLPLQ